MTFRTLSRTALLLAILAAGGCSQTSGQYHINSQDTVPEIRPGADDSGNCDPARHLQGYC